MKNNPCEFVGLVSNLEQWKQEARNLSLGSIQKKWTMDQMNNQKPSSKNNEQKTMNPNNEQ